MTTMQPDPDGGGAAVGQAGRPAPDSGGLAPRARLSAQERAVLKVLADNAGRVVSRAELAQRAGLANLSARRCDSLLVGIRRAVGADSIVTVRRRGWMLVLAALDGLPLDV